MLSCPGILCRGFLIVNRPLFLLLTTLALAGAIYWPGLSGGFLLDDDANLASVWRWLAGEAGWLQVVFGNESGPLGRPISMASFVATAAAWGQSVFAFKAVSLTVHLTIGFAIFLLLSQLLQRDRLMKDRRLWFAAAIAAVWVLHPLFASTVLYVVQRMAMLSALFVTLALYAYVRGRLDVESERSLSGSLWLFVGVPVFTALAALSKETGLLAPLLCAVLEWAYFRPASGGRRPKAARWFLSLFFFAPVVAGSLFLLLNPDFFLAGYENRPFNVIERLLTQSRVLFDYLGSLLLPMGKTFSLYRDDYLLSTGLLSPVTTLFSVLGWIILAATAILLRRAIPGLAAGLGIFLVGHSMESSFFPLLIYFEHRNYLPGLGIFLATASVLAYLGHGIPARMDHPERILGSAVAALLLILSFATFARALAWQSPVLLLEQSVEQYPDSRFARMELAAQIMNDGPRLDVRRAIEQYQHLQTLDLPSTQAIGYLGEIAVMCFATGATDPENLERAFSRQPETLQPDYLKTIESIGDMLRRSDCQGISPTELAGHIANLVDRTHLPPGTRTVWRLRFEAAQLYASRGQDRPALEQARLAWETGQAELPVGMLMAALHIRLGEFGAATRMLDEVGPRIPENDQTGQALLKDYRDAIDEGSRNSSIAPNFDD